MWHSLPNAPIQDPDTLIIHLCSCVRASQLPKRHVRHFDGVKQHILARLLIQSRRARWDELGRLQALCRLLGSGGLCQFGRLDRRRQVLLTRRGRQGSYEWKHHRCRRQSAPNRTSCRSSVGAPINLQALGHWRRMLRGRQTTAGRGEWRRSGPGMIGTGIARLHRGEMWQGHRW